MHRADGAVPSRDYWRGRAWWQFVRLSIGVNRALSIRATSETPAASSWFRFNAHTCLVSVILRSNLFFPSPMQWSLWRMVIFCRLAVRRWTTWIESLKDNSVIIRPTTIDQPWNRRYFCWSIVFSCYFGCFGCYNYWSCCFSYCCSCCGCCCCC